MSAHTEKVSDLEAAARKRLFKRTALAFTAAVLASSILSSGITAAVVIVAGQSPVLDTILDKSSYAPRDRVNQYAAFFDMTPNDLSNMESLTFIAPLDYECQSRAPHGPHPCPDGVPSKCRFYHFTDVTDICVYAYCKSAKSTDFNNPNFNNPDFTSFQFDDDYSECCAVYDSLFSLEREDLPMAPEEWPTATASGAQPEGLVKDAYDAAYAADETVCDAQIDWLHSNTWGHANWWDDHTEGAAPNFNVFKITRYEYAPAIGLQFYGTTGDTLIVERAGEAYYKPRGHADGLSIMLNESLMITSAALEAGAAASAASSGGRRLNAKGKPMSYDELIKDTRAGSGHPAFKDAFKGVAKVNRDEAPAGPMRRMLEEHDHETHDSRRKLGFFSALMTSGNFMMMQAGAF